MNFMAPIYPQPLGSGTPTGTVTFLDGGVSIGTGALSGGTATLTTASRSPSTHTITAIYSGDSNFQGCSTPALSQTVNQAASSTTVTSTANPAVFDQLLTFTATVAASAPATGMPTGTVTFLDGGVSIGTGTLSNGTATFTTASLSVAAHRHRGYGGDANFTAPTSANFLQTVNPANTTTTVTS